MESVEEYLKGVPQPQLGTLTHLREMLRTLLPDAVETISYGAPAFTVGGKTVAGFASYEDHCSYLPHSGSVLEQIPDELTDYRWSKGALRFPIDRPLPEPLIRRLVEVRLAELEG